MALLSRGKAGFDKLEDQPQALQVLEDFLQQAEAPPQAKALTKAVDKALRDVKALQAACDDPDSSAFLFAIVMDYEALFRLRPGQLLLSPPLAESLLSRERRDSLASLLHAVVAAKGGKGQRRALEDLCRMLAAGATLAVMLPDMFSLACLGCVVGEASKAYVHGLANKGKQDHDLVGFGVGADIFSAGDFDLTLPAHLLPEMCHLAAALLGSPAPADASCAAARQRLEELVEEAEQVAGCPTKEHALWAVLASPGGSGALADCRILLYGDILTKLHGPGGRLRRLGLPPLKLAAPAKHIGGEAWGLPSPLHAAMRGANEALALAYGQLSSVAARMARLLNTAAFTAEQRAAFVAPTCGALVARMRELENLAAALGLEGRLASAQHQVEAGKGGGVDGGVFGPAGSQAPASTRELELELELAEERRRRQAVEALVAEEQRRRQAVEALVAEERRRRQAAEALAAQLRGQLDKGRLAAEALAAQL